MIHLKIFSYIQNNPKMNSAVDIYMYINIYVNYLASELQRTIECEKVALFYFAN